MKKFILEVSWENDVLRALNHGFFSSRVFSSRVFSSRVFFEKLGLDLLVLLEKKKSRDQRFTPFPGFTGWWISNLTSCVAVSAIRFRM